MISTSTDRASAPATGPNPRFDRLPPALKVYLLTILVFSAITALALVYFHFTTRMQTAQLWSPTEDSFGDIWHYKHLFRHLHTQAFFDSADRFAYPAPCAVLYAMLYSFGWRVHTVYNILLATIYIGSGIAFFQVLLRLGLKSRSALSIVVFLMLTSYPWHTLYDRANLELFVYLFLATGVWAFLTGRTTLAAALWGCAGALKIYPAVLLVVFLRRATLRQLLVGVLTFAAVLFLSFLWVGPTLKSAALGSLNGVFGFLGHYAATARREELNIDHSILGAAKEILSLNILHLGDNWSNLSKYYQVLVVLAGPLLYLVRIRKLPVLNQLCLFLLAIVLLPPVSYDYTLIHTYLAMGIVLGAYLYALRRELPFPAANLYFIAFGTIATAQTWLQIRGGRFNGVIKCAALLFIAALLLRYPLRMGLPVEDLDTPRTA